MNFIITEINKKKIKNSVIVNAHNFCMFSVGNIFVVHIKNIIIKRWEFAILKTNLSFISSSEVEFLSFAWTNTKRNWSITIVARNQEYLKIFHSNANIAAKIRFLVRLR